jgi:hypothetical protein
MKKNLICIEKLDSFRYEALEFKIDFESRRLV